MRMASRSLKDDVAPAVPANGRTDWRPLKQDETLALLFGDRRRRQLQEIAGDAPAGTTPPKIGDDEQEASHHLKASSAALGLALASSVLPPLAFASGALSLYSCIPLFRDAYTAMTRDRRLRWTVLESVALLGMLAAGYVTAFALGSVIYFAGVRIMLRTEDRSRRSLKNVFGQQPRTVWVLLNDIEVEIPFEQLTAGSIIVVRAGQMVPIDGLVTDGVAVVDQHVLTGEAQPVERGPGEPVMAATFVLTGRILVRVEKAGGDTVAAQIHTILANTADYRVAVQARWQKLGDQSVLPTLGLSAVALGVLNPASAVAALSSNFTSILQIASPLGMFNFLQIASQSGLLIKDARALEAAHTVDTVVFDKTGTLTLPQPRVAEVHACSFATGDDVLTHAAAVEAHQSHPIALAILQAAAERNLPLPPLDDARYQVGYGIEARIGGRVVRVGSKRFLALQGIALPAEFLARLEAIQTAGHSLVYVAYGDQLAGAIELQPALRPGVKDVVRKLRERGLTVYIMSGDQSAATEALAADLGIDHYFAEVLPQDKSRLVERLQGEGHHVCFVGDGINDAIALKKADVSVSLRGGSALAANTAQIILMDESLTQLVQLFELARQSDSTTKSMLATTFLPGFISIGGVFFLHLGIYPVMFLYNLSMVAGLAAGMLPAFRQGGVTDQAPPGNIRHGNTGNGQLDALASEEDRRLLESAERSSSGVSRNATLEMPA
jgi:Cu2+-exporting ATPase